MNERKGFFSGEEGGEKLAYSASCNGCGWQFNGEILSRFPETAIRRLEQEHSGFAIRAAMTHHPNEAYSIELLHPYICQGPIQLKVESL